VNVCALTETVWLIARQADASRSESLVACDLRRVAIGATALAMPPGFA
jgi:hypothetical protein